MMLTIIVSCLVLMATAQDSDKDIGENGGIWRKALCEKNDVEMFKEMDQCFKMEDKIIQDATEKCAKMAHPASEGNLVEFMAVACGDLEIFKKFDACFEECASNNDFKSQMEVTDETIECYEKVIEKYEMETLKDYFKE